jgi:hypothetical protein
LTATHDVAEEQETELKSTDPRVTEVHEDPFQVDRALAVTSAQNPLVGHESVPGNEAKDLPAAGGWTVHVTPLKVRTAPDSVEAEQARDEVQVTPITRSPAGPVLVQVVPLNNTRFPTPDTATQNKELVHETARGPPVVGIFFGVPHETPFQMTASEELSTSMQKDELEHETTDDPFDPAGRESTINGADHDVPFHLDTASMESVATQNVADAQPTDTAGPVSGSTVWGDDQPAGSDGVWPTT